jgi:cytochrome c oxidase cbb3-type subunit 2
MLLVCAFQFEYVIPSDRGDRLRGEIIYFTYCSACHGENGDGDGPAKLNMYPPPRDFTSGNFKYRSTPSGSLPTDEDLRLVISRGIPQSWMPGWDDFLSETQISDVIDYLKLFKGKQQNWAEGIPLPTLTASQPLPSPAMIEQGEGLYLLLECWACHGLRGGGNGRSAKTLLDHKGRKVKASDLTRIDYRVGVSASEIRKTFLTGLSGTPMPSYEGLFVIPQEDVDEINNEELPVASREMLNNFVSNLPIYQDLDEITDQELESLSQYNEWALVYYVQSMMKKNSWFDWLFRLNPEIVTGKE